MDAALDPIEDNLRTVGAFSLGRSYVAHNLADLLQEEGFEVWVLGSEPVQVMVPMEDVTRARRRLPALRKRHGALFSWHNPFRNQRTRFDWIEDVFLFATVVMTSWFVYQNFVLDDRTLTMRAGGYALVTAVVVQAVRSWQRENPPTRRGPGRRRLGKRPIG